MHEDHHTRAMTLACMLAAGTQAYAEPVRFDNDGSFDWLFNSLDVTKAASEQPGTYGGASSIYMDYFGDFYPAFSYQHTYSTDDGAQIWSAGFRDGYAAPLAEGDLIGAGLTGGAWNAFTNFEFDWYACDYYYGGNCYGGNRGLLPEGEDVYLGVRFEGVVPFFTHYGWISVQRQGAFLDVNAWGYETNPDTPIAAGIPAPGTLAALAIGAVGVRRKSR